MKFFKSETAIINNTTIGNDTKVWHYANIYGCIIGERCTIGSYVEVQDNVGTSSAILFETGAQDADGVLKIRVNGEDKYIQLYNSPGSAVY